MRVDCNLFIALRKTNNDSSICGRKKRGFLGLGKKKLNGLIIYYLHLQCGTKKSEQYNVTFLIIKKLIKWLKKINKRCKNELINFKLKILSIKIQTNEKPFLFYYFALIFIKFFFLVK